MEKGVTALETLRSHKIVSKNCLIEGIVLVDGV